MSEADRSRARYVEAWTGLADLLDRQLSPLGLGAIDALAPRAGETMLDIGCGTGQTLGQLAERVGPAGRVIGVDIIRAFLACAEQRIGDNPAVSLIEHDASMLDLTDASVDGIFSRFGVMAIDEPAVAFANFRRMTRPGGRLAFVCWRGLEDNVLDWLPLRAAGLEQLVDRMPFHFEDRGYVRGLLERAGYRDIGIHAQDVAVSCGGLDETVRVLTSVGALGKILRDRPDFLAEAEGKVRDALLSEWPQGDVYLGSATWVVSATA